MADSVSGCAVFPVLVFVVLMTVVSASEKGYMACKLLSEEKGMFDFIGDIHGCAGHLLSLLVELGYEPHNGAWSHPERKAFFLGDFIDRGGQIPEALQIVREMVDSGNAIAIMGNHEYNAICFNIHDRAHGYLRHHSIQNMVQHVETIKQFRNHQDEYDDYVAWFRKLPLFYECDSFRAVHACWDQNHVNLLNDEISEKCMIDSNGCLTDDFFRRSSKRGTTLHAAVKDLLKGRELDLPEGSRFADKDGRKHSKVRIRWWQNPEGATFRDLSVFSEKYLPESPVSFDAHSKPGFYGEQEKPVFFGHYWLKGQPQLFRDNVCCLDYSVAKDGRLVAYRFDGESKLEPERFVCI